MLISDIELILWRYFLIRYFQNNINLNTLTEESVLLTFFLSAKFVKSYLANKIIKKEHRDKVENDKVRNQLLAIDAYITEYHFPNFYSEYEKFKDIPSGGLLSESHYAEKY